MVDDRPVGVTLTADTTQYSQSMQQAATDTNNLLGALDKVTETLKGVTRSAGKGFAIVAAADVAAITAATAAAASFEKQMSGLQAQAQALSGSMEQGKQRFASYTQAVQSMRREFPIATADATALVSVIAKLGDTSRPIEEVARSFAKLSASTGEPVTQLAASVLQLNRSMGNGTQDIERYNAAILKLSSSSGASASGLVQFANALAPASRILNQTEADLLGISAAFSRAGQDGNIAANIFTKMSTDITNAIQTNSPALRAYASLIGMTSEEFRRSNPTDNIAKIFSALNQQGQAMPMTLERFGFEGPRSARAISAVAQQGSIGRYVGQSRQAFDDPNGSEYLSRVSKSTMNDFTSNLGKLADSSKRIAAAFGAPFVAALNQVVKAMNWMANQVEKLVTGPIGQLAQGFAALLAPLAGVASALSFMTPGLLAFAGLYGLGGAGTAGFRQARGLSGPLTDTTSRLYQTGQLGWYRRGSYEMGQRVGGLIPGGGGPQRAWGRTIVGGGARGLGAGIRFFGGFFDPTRSSLNPRGPQPWRNVTQRYSNPNTPGSSGWWRNAWGRISGGAAPGMPGVTVPPPGAITGVPMIPAGAASPLSMNPMAQIRNFGSNMASMATAQAMTTAAAATTAQTAATKENTSAAKNLVRSITGFYRNAAQSVLGTSKIVGTAAGRQFIAAPPAGPSSSIRPGMASRAGGAIKAHPFMAGMLAYIGIDAFRNATDDETEAVDPNTWQPTAYAYANKAGVGLPSISSPSRREADLDREANKPISLADVWSSRSVSAAKNLATSSTYKPTDKRLVAAKSDREIVQMLAASLSGYDSVPPEMMAAIRNDVIRNKISRGGSAQDAMSLLAQVVNPSGGDYGGNRARAGGIAFDPGALLNSGATSGGRGPMSEAYAQSLYNINARYSTTEYLRGSDVANEQRAADFRKMDRTIFGEKGPWQDQIRSGHRIGDIGRAIGTGVFIGRGTGRQNSYIEALEKQYNGTIDYGAHTWDDIKSTENYKGFDFTKALSESIYKGDSTLDAQYFLERGMTPISSTMSEDEYKEAMKANEKIYNQKNWDTGSESGRKKAYENITKFWADTNEATAAAKVLIGSASGKTGPSDSSNVAKFKKNSKDATTIYQTVNAELEQLSKAFDGDWSKVANEARTRAAAVGPGDLGFDFYTQVAEAAGGREQAGIFSAQDRFESVSGRLDLLSKATPEMRKSAEWGQQAQTVRADASAVIREKEQQILQISQMSLDAEFQRSEAWISFAHTRERMEESYQISRKRYEESYELSRKYAQEDYEQSREYGLEDFNRQRKYQEEDFNHQLEIQAKRTAKSLMDVYQRVDVQRTISGANTMTNAADQLKRMRDQSKNLDLARKMGLSDDAIQQLGLTDVDKAQQLARYVNEFQGNQGLVGQFNTMAKNRIGAAKDLATDPSNLDWQEQLRAYNLSRDRGLESFEIGNERMEKAHDKSMKRMAKANRITMKQMSDDHERALENMQEDMQRSIAAAERAMNHSIAQFTRTSAQLRALARKNMSEAGKDAIADLRKDITGINNQLRDSLKESKTEIKTVVEDIVDILAGIVGIGDNASGSKPKTVRSRISSAWDAISGWFGDRGSGGADHVHGPNCGHAMGGVEYSFPMSRHSVSSGYGWRSDPINGQRRFHDGTDFPAPSGTPYYAPADGIVREIKSTGWGGRVPYIDHGGGLTTFYGHSSNLSVEAGDRVFKGRTKIGNVGSVGRATGPHLHFGAIRNGNLINPMSLLGDASAGPREIPGDYTSGRILQKLQLQKYYAGIEDPLKKFRGTTYEIPKGALSTTINVLASAAAAEQGVDVSMGGAEFPGGHSSLAAVQARTSVGLLNNAAGGIAQPVISNQSNIYRVDKSTTFTGPISVESNNPYEFMQQLEAKKRQDALLNPTLAGR